MPSGGCAAPRCSASSVVDLLVRFGDAVVDLGDAVEEMELNPVMVRAAGEGVVGLDALVRLAPAPGSATG